MMDKVQPLKKPDVNTVAQGMLRDMVGSLVLENIQYQAQIKLLVAENQELGRLAKVPDPRDRDSCRET